MEVQTPGRRNDDGTVGYSLFPPFRSMMYGPFLRLPRGRYCLTFMVQPGRALLGRHPVLGVEVIAQNRILQAWSDFTPAELRAGEQRMLFEVPEAISIESGNDAPFEFRFTAFGTCPFRVTKLSLAETGADEPPCPGEMSWRLLGRCRLFPLPGSLAISPLSIGRLTFGPPWTQFCLPAGRFNLDLDFRVARLKRPASPALELRLTDHEKRIIVEKRFLGRDLESGKQSIPFAIPPDLGYEAGMPSRLRIEMRQFGTARLALDDLRVVRVPGSAVQGVSLPARQVVAPASARKNLLILGNCQAQILARCLGTHRGFSKRFRIRHHGLELPPNLLEQSRRDLESTDVLLIQDIKEWEQYPLRDYVPPQAQILRYPCVRFASLWPFDAFNGPDDRLAAAKDYPNFEFTYFDGLLARLRRDIPDHEERFRVYRTLAISGIIDPTRLHGFEERRLLAMDKRFDIGLGAFVLENFRKRRLFHTTAHPNGRLLNMLLAYLERELGTRCTYWSTLRLDTLRDLQVPVHPIVAEKLAVTWADASTRYRYRGRTVTWDEYFRKYIAYYG
ncbi:hypothetical protein BIWAKO_02843 [Bosea sp. BIWAKO-01]|nr:hypothetical protein BIWAKO_02843 [Bosea sp. BIWAKO-01]